MACWGMAARPRQATPVAHGWSVSAGLVRTMAGRLTAWMPRFHLPCWLRAAFADGHHRPAARSVPPGHRHRRK
jgi:hypothetical protein